MISIHAPLTGSDMHPARKRQIPCYFNPRSPYGERHFNVDLTADDGLFQSTLPLRGATFPSVARSLIVLGFQSTLPLRGATQFTPKDPPITAISIHAPLTGSDLFT